MRCTPMNRNSLLTLQLVLSLTIGEPRTKQQSKVTMLIDSEINDDIIINNVISNLMLIDNAISGG